MPFIRQDTMREPGLKPRPSLLSLITKHAWGWGLQPLAAPREAGTTLRPGRGCGGWGSLAPAKCTDAEMGWGGLGPGRAGLCLGQSGNTACGKPQLHPPGDVKASRAVSWEWVSEQKGGTRPEGAEDGDPAFPGPSPPAASGSTCGPVHAQGEGWEGVRIQQSKGNWAVISCLGPSGPERYLRGGPSLPVG